MTRTELRKLLKPEISLAGQQYQRGFKCTYCNRHMDPPGTNSLLEATKDHVIPKSSLGKGQATLQVWSCYQCNFTKANMSWQSWCNFTDSHPKWWEKEKFIPQRGINSTQPKSKYLLKKENNMTQLIDTEGTVVPFRSPTNVTLLTGGKPPKTGNWLMDMDVGTKFTVKSRTDQKNFMGLDLELVNKTDKTVVLYELTSGQPLGGTGRVIPSIFTLQFDFVEVIPSWDELFENTLAQKETENSNGGSDRSGQSDA